MTKNHNIKSQIHLYSNPKLYNDFKESVKHYNEVGNTDTSISEVIRGLMADFIKQYHPNNKEGATNE